MVPSAQFGWSRGYRAPVWAGEPKIGMGALGDPASAAVGAAVSGGLQILTRIVSDIFKPDTDKIFTTGIVNQIEADVMKPNLEKWYALPQEWRTPAAQQQFLSVFDQGWAAVLKGCGNPQLGSAGVNCIGDRERGGKWDWFAYYRNPIATDPAVTQNAAAAGGTPATGGGTSAGQSQSATGGTVVNGGYKTGLYVGLGLVGLAVAFAVMGGGD